MKLDTVVVVEENLVPILEERLIVAEGVEFFITDKCTQEKDWKVLLIKS